MRLTSGAGAGRMVMTVFLAQLPPFFLMRYYFS
jgi:hypothetical protein